YSSRIIFPVYFCFLLFLLSRFSSNVPSPTAIYTLSLHDALPIFRISHKALLVAVVGIVVPFILGFLYMWLRGDGTTEATFVGAAMVATSVGITARVLGDLGVLDSRPAKIILGAAVFDDILGMVLLAVVAGL